MKTCYKNKQQAKAGIVRVPKGWGRGRGGYAISLMQNPSIQNPWDMTCFFARVLPNILIPSGKHNQIGAQAKSAGDYPGAPPIIEHNDNFIYISYIF